MTTEATPGGLGSNDQLGIVLERAAFERHVLQWTGRDMAYHTTYGTTGMEFALACWQTAVAAERERCARLCDEMAKIAANWEHSPQDGQFAAEDCARAIRWA